MTQFVATFALGAAILVSVSAWSVGAQAQSTDGPRFTADGRLVRPLDYRQWIFLSSGLGMTYGPANPSNTQPPMFDNVFVNRSSYEAFLKSGTWPDRTMFMLEIRRADANVSINNGGRTQGPIQFMEAAVKDVARFPNGGWAYFSFDGPDGPAASAAPLPETAACYTCHRTNTAVDNTFVQFYPELMDVARRMGTVKATYKE